MLMPVFAEELKGGDGIVGAEVTSVGYWGTGEELEELEVG